MATPTYTLIDSTTLTSTSSSVTFSSIPQTFGDLVIIFSGKTTGSSGQLRWSYNNSTVGYSQSYMEASGTTPRGSFTTSSDHLYVSYDYSELIDEATMARIEVMDYAATNKKSPAIIRGGRKSAGASASVGTQNNSAAISSIEFVPTVTLAIGSSFHIYGIAKAL